MLEQNLLDWAQPLSDCASFINMHLARLSGVEPPIRVVLRSPFKFPTHDSVATEYEPMRVGPSNLAEIVLQVRIFVFHVMGDVRANNPTLLRWGTRVFVEKPHTAGKTDKFASFYVGYRTRGTPV